MSSSLDNALWICRIIRRYIVREGELHVESDLPYGNVGIIDSKSHSILEETAGF